MTVGEALEMRSTRSTRSASAAAVTKSKAGGSAAKVRKRTLREEEEERIREELSDMSEETESSASEEEDEDYASARGGRRSTLRARKSSPTSPLKPGRQKRSIAHSESPSKRKRKSGEGLDQEGDPEDQGQGSNLLFQTKPDATRHARACAEASSLEQCAAVIVEGCGVSRESWEHASRGFDEDAEALGDLVASTLMSHVDEGEPLLGLKSQRSRKLEANFSTFFVEVVTHMHGRETLYSEAGGGGFLASLKALVTAVSRSEVRQFRYAAVLAGYSVVSACVSVLAMLRDQQAVLSKQMQGGKARSKGKAGGANMKHKLTLAHHRSTVLEAFVKEMFQELVIVRFRDVAPAIRALTIKSVGSWVMQFPAKFMSDSYLKYIAWSMNDKEAAVRLAAVGALAQVYSRKENLAALDLLTDRFLPRFLQIVRDKDEAVAARGLDLLHALTEYAIVKPDDLGDVYLLLLDPSRAVRGKAGKLVALVLRRRLERERSDPARVKAVAAFLDHVLDSVPEGRKRALAGGAEGEEAEGEGEDKLGTVAVGAIAQHIPLLSEWELLAKCVQQQDQARSGKEADATAMLRTVLAAVQCFTDPSMLRHPTKRESAKVLKDRAEKNRQQFTSAFIAPLEQQLSQSKAHPGRVPLLVSLLMETKTEVFSLKRQDKALESVVHSVRDVLLASPSPRAVDSCAAALVALASPSATGEGGGSGRAVELAQNALEECAEEVCRKAGKAAALVCSNPDSYDLTSEEEDVVFNLKGALGRAHALQKRGARDICLREDFTSALDQLLAKTLEEGAVEESQDDNELAPRVLGLAALNLFDGMLWKLSMLQGAAGKDLSVARLLQAQASLAKHLEAFLSRAASPSRQNDPAWQDQRDLAYRMMSDLCFVFGPDKLAGTPAEMLGLVPSETALRGMWAHCEEAIRARLEQQQRQRDDGGDAAPADDPARCLEAASQLLRLVGTRTFHTSRWLVTQLCSYTACGHKTLSSWLKATWDAHAASMSAEVWAGALAEAHARARRTSGKLDESMCDALVSHVLRKKGASEEFFLDVLCAGVRATARDHPADTSAVSEVFVHLMEKLGEDGLGKVSEAVKESHERLVQAKSAGAEVDLTPLEELNELLVEVDDSLAALPERDSASPSASPASKPSASRSPSRSPVAASQKPPPPAPRLRRKL